MAFITPTDRPKSVRNRCVIEVIGGVFVLSHCFLDFFVGVRAFVIGLNQISSFFSYNTGLFPGLWASNIPRYWNLTLKGFNHLSRVGWWRLGCSVTSPAITFPKHTVIISSQSHGYCFVRQNNKTWFIVSTTQYVSAQQDIVFRFESIKRFLYRQISPFWYYAFCNIRNNGSVTYEYCTHV